MDNSEIKTALASKGNGDAALVALLGGEYVFEAGLKAKVDDLDAWVTYMIVSQVLDLETDHADQVWQFDVWSRKSETGDAVAARLSALYGWKQSAGGGTLPGLTTRRLAEPVYEEPTPSELQEDSGAGTLHHKVRQFRVATYPA